MTIGTNDVLWDIGSLKTKTVTLKAKSANVKAKKGHPVFMNPSDGSWSISAVGKLAAPQYGGAEGAAKNIEVIGILAEDLEIATGGTPATIIVNGLVYHDAVRNAGFDTTNCPDYLLDYYSAVQSAITFVRKEV